MAKAVKVIGRERLQKKLDAMPAFARKEIRTEMARQADIIVALAKNLVPVGDGTLRDSIGWVWGDTPKRATALAEGRAGDLILTIYAGNNEAFYARWIEFGTVKMAAHPYFFPAYHANRRDAENAIQEAFRKAAKRAAAA